MKQLDPARSQLVQKLFALSIPNADVRFARSCRGLPRHLVVRSERHREFDAARQGSAKRLTVEKFRLYVARSHWLPSEGSTHIVDQNGNY